MVRLMSVAALLSAALLLQACLVGTVAGVAVGTAGAVVKTTGKVAGAVIP